MKKILLAEDDFDLSAVLKQFLELSNFNVTCAENGEKALELFQIEKFEICILDVMMPIMDGFTLAEKMTEINPEIPFIFLTAKKLKEDKIKGLQLGADDYIEKPFDVDELVLRINNIIKRSENKTFTFKDNTKKIIGKYIFDAQNFRLQNENITQQLSEKETALIHFFYIHKNQLIKREQILNAIWNNNDYFSGRSMDVFISRIRKYFQDDTSISIESKRFKGIEFKITEKK